MGQVQILTSHASGEVTPLLKARVDLGLWPNAAQVQENFLLWPQGPVQSRSGTLHVAEVIDSTEKSRMIPFKINETTAYTLEFGDQLIRVYKDNGTTPVAVGVDVVSPYLEAELYELQFEAQGSDLYITHENHATRRLTRLTDVSWSLNALNFNPPLTDEIAVSPATTLTLAALTGTSINFTAGAATFQNGDIGRIITAGTGKASIVGFTSPTIAICDIIDDFDSSPYASGEWSMLGSTFGEVTPSADSPAGAIITLTSTGEAEVLTNLILETASCPSADWLASGAGVAGTFYLLNTAAGYTATQPDRVKEQGAILPTGAILTLGQGQWAWGDADALGYNTIYIRLTDDADPDTKCGTPTYVQRAQVDPAADLFRSTDVGKYMYINGGVVKITTYVDAQTVKGEIIRVLDDTTASFDWTIEDAIWSDALGYPKTLAFHQDRLNLGGSTSFPNVIGSSVVGDYTNFARGTNDDDAFKSTITGNILWLSSRNNLLIGTDSAEWILRSTGAVLTPSDRGADDQTDNGSKAIQPVSIDGSLFHVQRKGRKLRELNFDFESDSYIAPDRTLLAEHITKNEIIVMDYQQEPLKTLWCVRGDGQLLGFTYMRDENIVAWHRHIIAGSFGSGDAVVESVAVIPHPTEDYDQVWMTVKRTVDGATVRYIEVFKPHFDSDSAADSWALDSAISYSGVSTSTITGLTHLVGETVSVVSNGAYIGDFTVDDSGEIDLGSKSTTSAVIGLKYICEVQKLPLSAGIGGRAQAQRKKINKMILRFYRTIGAKAGYDQIDTVSGFFRDGSMSMSQVADLFTGDKEINVEGGYRRDWPLTVRQELPLPMTLLAILPEGEYTSGTD
jgi:hypothetical protein